jgi:hypothetical protein
MAVGRLGGGQGIYSFNDECAWAVNNSGLSQERKDRWNAMRALHFWWRKR